MKRGAAHSDAPAPPSTDSDELHAVVVHLDSILARSNMTLAELSQRAGVTVANLAVLKNGRARAIRFSTLTALCRALDCTPGELLSIRNT